MPAKVDDVAAYILARHGSMTTWKLQKLVYYSQSWHLATTGRPLFGDQIEAWREGPVVPSLYYQHRGRYNISAWPSGNPQKVDAGYLPVINWVIEHYGDFSGVELSRMTHAELPWYYARGALGSSERSNVPLSHDIIRDFYARQRTSPDAAVMLATANAALEGIEFDDDWQQQLRDIGGAVSADELVAREIARHT